MNYSKILRIANIFSTLSSDKCRICGADGTVFMAADISWYCDLHAGYCDFCKKPLLKEQSNAVFNNIDYRWLHPACHSKIECPHCLELIGEHNLKIKSKINNIDGCSECVEQCVNCNDSNYKEYMREYENELNDYYCNDCFNSLFSFCDTCEETIPTDEALVNTKTGEVGCSECSALCAYCDQPFKKDDMQEYQGDLYCDDCFSEEFYFCEGCEEVVPKDDIKYTENAIYCESCFDENFAVCYECSETINKEDAFFDADGDAYCEECRPSNQDVPEEYIKYTENFGQLSYSSQSRNIRELRRIVPISIKKLKSEHSKLFNSCKDIIVFAGGKDITDDVLSDFEAQQLSTNYLVEYSGWNDNLQRSVEDNREVGQLVLQIVATPEMIEEMSTDKTYELFNLINETSERSGHPAAKNQIGWARLELNEDEEYILIDEIQCDHMNAISRIYKEKYQDSTYEEHMRDKWGLSEEEMKNITEKLKEIIKPFPLVVTEAISEFAKKNGFKKLFWHTYESGKKLKHNEPPKSLYTVIPRKNYFQPTEERPFDLEGKFLARLARKMQFKLIKKSKLCL